MEINFILNIYLMKEDLINILNKKNMVEIFQKLYNETLNKYYYIFLKIKIKI
jgi:hypothetical protein